MPDFAMHLQPDSELLSSLLTQIRDAWEKDRDVTPVHHLASAYPDLADTLYEYVGLLVELALDEQAPDQAEREEFAERVRVWFASSAVTRAW